MRAASIAHRMTLPQPTTAGVDPQCIHQRGIMRCMASLSPPDDPEDGQRGNEGHDGELQFPEGPRWHDGALWFSDQLGGRVLRQDGDTMETAFELGRPSGLGFLSDGTMRVATMEPPEIVDVPSGVTGQHHVDLSTFGNHLNDLVVDRFDRTYVDVYQNYGERPNGSLVLVDPDGRARLVAEQLAFPNGVAVTPDGSTLIVSETFAGCLTAFDVATDGSLRNRRVWADLPGAHPDGLCLDSDGAVWVASFLEGEFLKVTEGGAIVERIVVADRWALSCCLGGDDGRTLFCCTAVTTQRDYLNGHALGFVDPHRVDVQGVGCP
jgi:sugar lactone lactonase YvrE